MASKAYNFLENGTFKASKETLFDYDAHHWNDLRPSFQKWYIMIDIIMQHGLTSIALIRQVMTYVTIFLTETTARK